MSYSNFKRHLRNAHPNEYKQCEKEPTDNGNDYATFTTHLLEENEVDVDHDGNNGMSDGEQERMEQDVEVGDREQGKNSIQINSICKTSYAIRNFKSVFPEWISNSKIKSNSDSMHFFSSILSKKKKKKIGTW